MITLRRMLASLLAIAAGMFIFGPGRPPEQHRD